MEKAVQVDQHSQVKKKDDNWLEQNWNDGIQFNEKYSEWKRVSGPKHDRRAHYNAGWTPWIRNRRPVLDESARTRKGAYTLEGIPCLRKASQTRRDRCWQNAGRRSKNQIHTRWTSPTVFAPIKNRSFRFFVDYREVNAVIVCDSHHISRKGKCIHSLSDKLVLWNLGANPGYCQIEMDKVAKAQAAFVTHHELFRYKRMLFTLKNASATIQCGIEVILSMVKWKYALVCLNDVAVFSQWLLQHIGQVATVLKLMSSARHILKLKKCFFAYSFCQLPWAYDTPRNTGSCDKNNGRNTKLQTAEKHNWGTFGSRFV